MFRINLKYILMLLLLIGFFSPTIIIADIDQKAFENIEKRQDIVIEAMEDQYKYGLWFIVSITGLIALLSGIRYVQDQRIMKLQEQQLADAKGIGKIYEDIMKLTKEALEFYAKAQQASMEAQEALKVVSQLEAQQQKESSHWEEQMHDLNDNAIVINLKCRRDSHNNPEIQRLVREFAVNFNVINSSYETQEKLNANGHFILGLHYRIENNYDVAVFQFNKAISIAKEHKDKETEIYRALPSNISKQEWLTKLQNITAYHIAILQNNLGQYQEALKSFELALSFDSLDYQSLSYIPEVMFLGWVDEKINTSFSAIVDKFNEAINEIKQLKDEKPKGFTLSKNSLLAILNLKLANCYMANKSGVNIDINKAESHLNESLKLDGNNIYAKLSLAQLLHMQGREEVKQKKLFLDVFSIMKDKVSNITETKIMMMNYYIMVICCSYGKIPNELPSIYAMKVYELVPRLPDASRIKIFSPLSKVDLGKDTFILELKDFDKVNNKDINSIEANKYPAKLPLVQSIPPQSEKVRATSRYRL